jgi:hypothetical protein
MFGSMSALPPISRHRRRGKKVRFAPAVATTYIVVGILVEVRDLVDLYCDEYRRYKDRVSMLVPWRSRPR